MPIGLDFQQRILRAVGSVNRTPDPLTLGVEPATIIT